MNTTNTHHTPVSSQSASSHCSFGFGPQLYDALTSSSGPENVSLDSCESAPSTQNLPDIGQTALILREYLLSGGYPIDLQVCEAVLQGLSLPDDARGFLSALERVVALSADTWRSLVERLAYDILTEALGIPLTEAVFVNPIAPDQPADRQGNMEQHGDGPANGRRANPFWM